MRKWASVVITLAAGLAACSSSTESSEPAGPCAARQGTYRVSAVVRSGTCDDPGTTAEAVVAFDQAAGYASGGGGCQAAYVRATDDNCTIEYDETCPLNVASLPNGTVRKIGKAVWNTSSTSGTTTEAWTIANRLGQIVCTSTVDVTYTKQ